MRGDTQATYGSSDGTPAIASLKDALDSLDSTQSFAFRFRPGVPVRARGHLQGIARLPDADDAPGFVMTKHHHDDARQAGVLFYAWPDGLSDGAVLARAPGPRVGFGELTGFLRNFSEHPGGMQRCGHILAIANDPNSPARRPFILFMNVGDPRRPFIITRLTLDGSHGEKVSHGLSCAALTRLEDQRYLLLAYRYSSSNDQAYQGWFFRTRDPFLNANSSFEYVGGFDGATNSARSDWSDACDNMAFVNQADGAVFLVGMRGKTTDNHLDVYRVEGDPPTLRYRFSKRLRTRDGGATFRAGGSLHITPQGELVVYAVQKSVSTRRGTMLVEEFSSRR